MIFIISVDPRNARQTIDYRYSGRGPRQCVLVNVAISPQLTKLYIRNIGFLGFFGDQVPLPQIVGTGLPKWVDSIGNS
jgi:hypothetical protein